MPDNFATGKLDIRFNFDNLGTQLDVEHSRNVAESSVEFILQFANLVELAIAKTNLRLSFSLGLNHHISMGRGTMSTIIQ